MIRRDNLEYEELRVQPKEYTVGELEWEYNFDIEIEISTGFLQTYIVFISMAIENTHLELARVLEFREQFDQALIDAGVQYAFEDTDETHSIMLSFELVRGAILEFQNASEDQLFLQMGGTFIDLLAEQYEQRVGFSPQERIPGPIVPSKYQAICPECQSSLDVHLFEEQNHMYCASCDSVRDDPTEWDWLTPDPAPKYTDNPPENQPDLEEAACPNCGSRLSFYHGDVVGHCRECRGLWRQGTWHRFDLVDPEAAACPDCGSELTATKGSESAFCESCDSMYDQRDWERYDPVLDAHEFPVEVEPGVVQISERKYRVKSTDHLVDSLWEADIDQRLAKLVPNHEREPGPFKISGGYYTPDFRVEDLIIEIKGIQHDNMLESAISKAESFQKQHPDFTYVVIGDDATEEIPSDKWFKYPSERFGAVKWISQQ